MVSREFVALFMLWLLFVVLLLFVEKYIAAAFAALVLNPLLFTRCCGTLLGWFLCIIIMFNMSGWALCIMFCSEVILFGAEIVADPLEFGVIMKSSTLKSQNCAISPFW